MRKAQVRPLRDQQVDREVDCILIGLAQIDELVCELIGILNVPTHGVMYSIDGI
jgi:hypothetical protein